MSWRDLTSIRSFLAYRDDEKYARVGAAPSHVTIMEKSSTFSQPRRPRGRMGSDGRAVAPSDLSSILAARRSVRLDVPAAHSSPCAGDRPLASTEARGVSRACLVAV
jgi:hypothetical protein